MWKWSRRRRRRRGLRGWLIGVVFPVGTSTLQRREGGLESISLVFSLLFFRGGGANLCLRQPFARNLKGPPDDDEAAAERYIFEPCLILSALALLYAL